MIIDEDKALCRSMQIQIEQKGYSVMCVHSAEEGLVLSENFNPDAAFLDLKLPGKSGMQALEDFQEKEPNLPVVMITGSQDMKSVIEAMKKGAFDYIRKPFDIDDLSVVLEKLKNREKKQSRMKQTAPSLENLPTVSSGRYEIIGSDASILEMMKKIGLLSRSRVNVLIEGESGTGKELVARALHNSTAPEQPFVAITCTAVVPTLLESELFGHEKGAFTGAHTRKTGKLEYAGDGTLFLDEIGDMPLDLQSKLLRVLQEREFERVGGLKSIPFLARIVAATNRNLLEMVEEGSFRSDLYYRLLVARIHVPPLRERRGDIPQIARYLCERIAEKTGRRIERIREDAISKLQEHDWPGNVRELENALTRAMVLTRENTLTADDLELSIEEQKYRVPGEIHIKTLNEIEKEHITRALFHNNWNITRTARILDISPNTLRKKIGDYELKP